MNWQVVIHLSAGTQKFPLKDSGKIEAALDEFEGNPYAGDIQKMEGEKNVWRRRAGVYRIFYELSVEKRIVFVFYIERRTSKTY